MSKINDKNFLLISPKYFNYENDIISEIRNSNGNIFYINDRINDNILIKTFFKISLLRKILMPLIFLYFKNNLNKAIKSLYSIDYLIAIIPEGFSKEVILFYKKRLPETRFIL